MTYTKIAIVYCSVAFILLLSLSTGVAINNTINRISTLEDKVSKLESEFNKREMLSDNTSSEKSVVVIQDRKRSDTKTEKQYTTVYPILRIEEDTK